MCHAHIHISILKIVFILGLTHLFVVNLYNMYFQLNSKHFYWVLSLDLYFIFLL